MSRRMINYLSMSLSILLIWSCTNLGEEPELLQFMNIEPDQLDFGSVALGGSSELNLTISNSGDKTVTISSFEIIGDPASEFEITAGGSAVDLAVDSKIVLTLKFKPASAGAKSAALEIVSDDPESDTTLVSLSGTGGTAVLTYNSTISAIIGPSGSAGCATGCHTFVTSSGWTYSAIVNVAASTGMNYITPGDTSDSYLFLKVKGASGISGGRMPASDPAYFDNHLSDLDLLRQWILQGAREG